LLTAHSGPRLRSENEFRSEVVGQLHLLVAVRTSGRNVAHCTNSETSRAEGQTISSVDLHGLQVKEARQVLHSLLDLYADTKTKFLRVITGAGKHSIGGQAKLRPEVEDLLQNRQLEYQLVGDGAFLVYLR
jgi:hypothetical protein